MNNKENKFIKEKIALMIPVNKVYELFNYMHHRIWTKACFRKYTEINNLYKFNYGIVLLGYRYFLFHNTYNAVN